jgi:hypothetical protein
LPLLSSISCRKQQIIIAVSSDKCYSDAAPSNTPPLQSNTPPPSNTSRLPPLRLLPAQHSLVFLTPTSISSYFDVQQRVCHLAW